MSIEITATLIERFFGKCVPEPNTGCWLWMAGCDADGYGKFQITNHGAGPKQFHVRAHRFALATRLGRMPVGLALHRCDQPCCVNPDHLREGTQKENIADMDARGRRGVKPLSSYLRGDEHPLKKHPELRARGERHGSRTKPQSVLRGADHPHALLTVDAVLAVRAAKGSMKARDVAALHGVKKSTVYALWSKRIWRHL